MNVPSSTSKSLSVLCIAAALFTATAPVAQAAHTRYGSISWTSISGTQPGTYDVTFTVTQAFRSFSRSETLRFGDGTSYFISSTEFNNNVIAGQVGSGEVFISRVVVHKTYGSDGPFTAFIQSCCRISGIQNISGSYRFPTVVDLRDGNRGSPVSGAPVVLQMVQGGLNTASLSVSHPQGRPVTSGLATAAEMGSPNYWAPPGLTIDPATALLSWDTSGTSIGQLWQVGVVVEKAGSNTSSTQLDFIIEIVDGTLNQPPTITGSVAEGSSHVVGVGQTFTVMVEGDDPDGDDLTINHLGLPSGATLTPAAGTTGPSPFEPDDSTGDGAFSGDVDGHDGYQDDVTVEIAWNSATGRWEGALELRAERSGRNKDGRKYTFHCLAADHHGNFTQATACVLVPHNQGRGGR